MQSRDGGPAFPTSPQGLTMPDGARMENTGRDTGMTLLDWFAGQIAAAINGDIEQGIAVSKTATAMGCSAATFIARAAYDQADALLRERERREKGE